MSQVTLIFLTILTGFKVFQRFSKRSLKSNSIAKNFICHLVVQLTFDAETDKIFF